MTRHPVRCERNLATSDEDCGRRVAYHACGKPAHWFIEEDGWAACEEHTLEYLRSSDGAVVGLDDGEPMAIDADGELEVAL